MKLLISTFTRRKFLDSRPLNFSRFSPHTFHLEKKIEVFLISFPRTQGKKSPGVEKKRMTLAQPHALLNRSGHIFPVSHCRLRILLKNRGFPPPSHQETFQQGSIQKQLFSTPLSIHSIHFIQFIQFTFIPTSQKRNS